MNLSHPLSEYDGVYIDCDYEKKLLNISFDDNKTYYSVSFKLIPYVSPSCQLGCNIVVNQTEQEYLEIISDTSGTLDVVGENGQQETYLIEIYCSVDENFNIFVDACVKRDGTIINPVQEKRYQIENNCIHLMFQYKHKGYSKNKIISKLSTSYSHMLVERLYARIENAK